jgi:hypothetical protein
MTEPTRYGAVTLPLEAPAPGMPLGDPLLYYAGHYLLAYFNAHGQAAWRAVAPTLDLVKRVFTHNPLETVFNDNDTPALYLWRGDLAGAEQVTDGLRLQTWPVMASIVLAQAPREKARAREPVVRGLGALLDEAIEADRDPAWKVAGDADSYAATRGSSLRGWARFWRMQVARAGVGRMAITVDGTKAGKPQRTQVVYRTFDFTLLVEEALDRGDEDTAATSPGTPDGAGGYQVATPLSARRYP